MKRYSIIGPPGTGKTTEIISRIQNYLGDGVKQQKIGLTTFSKAAASELAKRSNLTSDHIGTLHSLAFRIAGMYRDSVFTGNVVKEFGEHIGIPISCGNVIDGDQNIEIGDELLAIYMIAASKVESWEEAYASSNRPTDYQTFIYFCNGIEEYKKFWGYQDFNDMLRMAINSEEIPNLDILFVDEAQDLSPLQWQLVNKWTEVISSVHIAGDDDQAIYSWGGADPHGIAKWEDRWKAERKVLTQSYRVPKAVHKISTQILAQIKERIHKEYKPRSTVGSFSMAADIAYLDLKHGEETVILYRNHFIRNDFEDVLIDGGIPYEVVSGKPSYFTTQYSNCIRAFIKAQGEQKQFGQFQLTRQLRYGKRWMLSRTFHQIVEKEIIPNGHWADHFQNGPYMQYLLKVENNHGPMEKVFPTISLSTIHGFKGREADRVVLIDSLTQRTMDAFSIDPDSEYRVFYVGATRAKNKLDLITGDNCLITPMIYAEESKDQEEHFGYDGKKNRK